MKFTRRAFVKTRSKSARRLALIFGAGALIYLAYTAIRSKILLNNGGAIAAQSANFARDYFVGEAGAPTFTYLALGDSTAAGWGAGKQEKSYPHLVAQAVARRGLRVRVVNVAVGGAKARDVAALQLAAISQIRPDLITLSVGANDATHFTTPDEFRRDLTAILSALKQSKARTILVADTPDMFLAPALPWPIAAATARRARAQNAITRQLTRDSRVQIVELYQRGKLDARRNPKLYAADRFHPSASGYARWAQLFIEKL